MSTWRRTRSAVVATIAASAIHASAASAEVLVVTTAERGGTGSLAEAVDRTNSNLGADRIEFADDLAGLAIQLPRRIAVTDSVKIGASKGDRPIELDGTSDRGGSRISFRPKPFSILGQRMVLRGLSTRNVRVSTDGEISSAELRIFNSALVGDGHGVGIAIDGFRRFDFPIVRDVEIAGFRTGVAVRRTGYGLDATRAYIHDNGLGVSASNGSLDIRKSTVSDNAPRGGMTGDDRSGFYIRRSTISGNEDSVPVQGLGSAVGGGVDVAGPRVKGVLISSTITGNRATGPGAAGGGLYGSFQIDSSTIAGNSAETGGGIASSGQTTIRSTIIAANSAPIGRDCTGTFLSTDYNLLGPEGCAAADGPGDIRTLDPGLEPLADNGGPTETLGLRPDSPAIGAGLAGLSTDQRGVRRNDPPDIGSFELP